MKVIRNMGDMFRRNKLQSLLFILFCFLFSPVGAQRLDDVSVHSKYIQAVDEYCPAPGQFVNAMPEYEEGDDAARMAQKCTESLANNQRDLVCLGGYGGYITFHFDHSIANIEGQRDFFIEGNAIKEASGSYEGGSSEPGIVMVAQDADHDGNPDAWYEISGSADVDSVGKVIYDYEITYSPNPMGDIPWTDNKGGSGVIERMSKYNITGRDQEYYPLWITGDIVRQGTLLPKNGVNTKPNAKNGHWVLMFLREGYADNKPNSDKTANSFDISWAVDKERQKVSLQYIDFVRVYTGLNQSCGWLGETSTEIAGAEDLHLDESVARIKELIAGIHSVAGDGQSVKASYTLDGRRCTDGHRGIRIVRLNNGTTKKFFLK